MGKTRSAKKTAGRNTKGLTKKEARGKTVARKSQSTDPTGLARAFNSIIDSIPVPVWEEDYSAVKRFFDRIRKSGTTDLRRHFAEHPGDVKRCAALVKIKKINKASLVFFGARTKAEIVRRLPEYFSEKSYEVFRERLVALAEGGTSFTCEEQIINSRGGTQQIKLSLSVPRGCEKTLSKVLVSFIDITDRVEAARELESFFNLIPDMVCIASTDGRFKRLNPEWTRALGYSIEELMAIPYADLIHPDDKRATFREIRRQTAGEPTVNLVNRFRAKDGGYRWFEWNALPARDGMLYAVARDITERREREAEFRFKEQYLRSIIHNEPECVKLLDEGGRIIEMNPSGLAMIQAESLDQVKGAEAQGIVAPEHRRRFVELTKHVIAGKPGTLLFKIVGLRGAERWLETRAVPFADPATGRRMLLGVTRDVTENVKTEEALKRALHEKSMLVRETHHRTKNNLAILQSIISIQALRAGDSSIKAQFMDLQSRVQTLSLIHERLYRTEATGEINAGEYVSDLARHLHGTLGGAQKHVALRVDADSAMMDVTRIVPCGLILNELITNAMKYGFPGGGAGEVVVTFKSAADHYLFSVADNGVGVPDDFDMDKTQSFGLLMISNLTRQVNGRMEVVRGNGVEFRLTFGKTPG